MDKRMCTEPGCEQQVFAKGMCKKCYMAARSARLAQDQCRLDDCERPRHTTDGLCVAHYQRQKQHGDPLAGPPMRRQRGTGRARDHGLNVRPCAVSSCVRSAEKRDWCGNHYIKWRKYGDPEGKPAPRSRKVCAVGPCAELSKTMTDGDSGRYCRAHYKRLMRYGDPEGIPAWRYPEDATERACTKCGEVKPLDGFAYQREGQFGRHAGRRVCLTARKKAHAQSLPPDMQVRKRRATAARKYGLDGAGVFDRIQRGDPCDVCRSYTERMHIDHCHDTGKVRGLLCSNCNSAMGLVSDDPTRLRMLAAYLELAVGKVGGERSDGPSSGHPEPLGGSRRSGSLAA